MLSTCWKCKQAVKRRARYCPHCGIVKPRTGHKKYARLKEAAVSNKYISALYAVFLLSIALASVCLFGPYVPYHDWGEKVLGTLLAAFIPAFLIMDKIEKTAKFRHIEEDFLQKKKERLNHQADALVGLHPEFNPKTSLLRPTLPSLSADPETLLRAAQPTPTEADDHLLRASAGPGGKTDQ